MIVKNELISRARTITTSLHHISVANLLETSIVKVD